MSYAIDDSWPMLQPSADIAIITSLSSKVAVAGVVYNVLKIVWWNVLLNIVLVRI